MVSLEFDGLRSVLQNAIVLGPYRGVSEVAA